MHLIKADDPQAAARAAEVLRAGGVVLFPTDTLYALGADALSDAAVDTIYAIKVRDRHKPMHALVSDVEMVGHYGYLNATGSAILAKTPAGKVSLVVPKVEGIDTGIMRDMTSFGFRIPQHALCQAIITAFGGPITATSANVSDREVSQSLGAILAQLGPAVSLIDLAIDGGTLSTAVPSTVIDVRTDEAHVLRPGAVDIATI
jgi:L-threonylcarbamoyladenylate synthase